MREVLVTLFQGSDGSRIDSQRAICERSLSIPKIGHELSSPPFLACCNSRALAIKSSRNDQKGELMPLLDELKRPANLIGVALAIAAAPDFWTAG
jgi:hypothetical protein